MTPEEAVGLFADETRLRVIAAVVLKPGSSEELAERSGTSPRKTIETLTRLEAAGVAHRDGAQWRFDIGVLREAAKAARPDPGSPAATSEEAVLRSFVVDGRLVQIPASRSKRLIVLDRLASEFEPARPTTRRRSTRSCCHGTTMWRRCADTSSTRASSAVTMAPTGGPAAPSSRVSRRNQKLQYALAGSNLRGEGLDEPDR